MAGTGLAASGAINAVPPRGRGVERERERESERERDSISNERLFFCVFLLSGLHGGSAVKAEDILNVYFTH